MIQITLKAARINAGLTLKEASERLDINMSTLRSWEDLTTFPNAKQIKKIEEVYNMPYDNIKFFN